METLICEERDVVVVGKFLAYNETAAATLSGDSDNHELLSFVVFLGQKYLIVWQVVSHFDFFDIGEFFYGRVLIY